VATVKLVTAGGGPRTRLVLQQKLTHRYRRTSVRVLLNVAKATHGESRAEILGSGDQRVPFQSFTLRQRPLTHVTAGTASGTQTTLAVWVAGVRWTEVPSLFGQPPDARVYVARRADDGSVTVTTGDGRTAGARLPTGQDNVVATYRVGIGRTAILPADRITIPLARPLGLLNVTNPVAAAGADDPEPLAAARRNAPLTVRTMGRIVSALDYEDLAAGFAGIGQARADVLWDGERATVHLTVTGPDGEAVDETSAVHTDLHAAIDAVRHATVPVVVESRHDRRFAVAARLVTSPDRRPADVIAEARETLLQQYAFAVRALAVPVTAAEVVTTLQNVPGVTAVLLDAFHEKDLAATKESVIPALPARRVRQATLPADLVTIEPDQVDLTPADPTTGVQA
jgi:predicted phage baseplate assembly protein